jgi:anti-repressor protein
MNNLMEIRTVNNRQTVLGRELHKFLEIGQDYTNWFKRMCEYGFEEIKDFVQFANSSESDSTGLQKDARFVRAKYDHQLTLSMAKEISMIQRSDKGKQARLYFIKCEEELKNQFKLPTNYKEALIALVQAEEEKEKIQSQLEESEKLNNMLLHTNKLYTITEIAKECGLNSATQLNNILADKKIQFKQNNTWLPYSKYSDLGYFSIKQEVLDNGVIIYNRKITNAGR